MGLTSLPQSTHTSLRQQQLQYPRVRTAAREKDDLLHKLFTDKGLAYPPRSLLLRAFKKEGQLELWASNSDTEPYTLVKTYGICATSGVLGPKRRFGDAQVPEGFYELDWFNPQSNFYLSLHISYPNAADRILKTAPDPGGTIFLHGNCVTIGCIPITDGGIKEVYWLAVLAESSGHHHVPIEIFPTRLSDAGWRYLSRDFANRPELMAFWRNLQPGYDIFEKTHLPPRITVSRNGDYVFSAR